MSSVIKAGEAGKIGKRLTTIDLADHVAEARAFLEKAKRESARIVADAKREATRLFEEARREGHERGHAEGLEEGRAAGREQAHVDATARFDREHADVVAAMTQAVGDIEAMKEALAVEAERDLLEFAVSVARKLTFDIGELHREAGVENLRRAVALVGTATDLTVHVHPDDLDSIRTFADSVLARTAASSAVNIVSDDSLAPGGCRVSTASTQIDATLETQVEEMLSLLLGKRTDA
jgi:flagellar assembly protein FliH